ncbi:hypothetical protein KW783_01410 [Candidatus Parcubacteria bacterium]|nr:hypothetical protein [Candidatus Parcubacteria bacterium]
MAKVTKKFLQESVKTLLVLVQEYCRSQVDLWRKIPWLALEADGRDGHNDIFSWAWAYGYWPIHVVGDARSGYTIFMDLSTGKMVNAHDQTRSPDEISLLIILSALENIDAMRITTMLTQEGKKSVKKYMGSSKDKRKWRKEMQKKYNVRTIFVRKIPALPALNSA